MKASKQGRKKEKEIEIIKFRSLHIKVSWVFCTSYSVLKSSECYNLDCYDINRLVFAIYADITSRNVTQKTLSPFFSLLKQTCHITNRTWLQ